MNPFRCIKCRMFSPLSWKFLERKGDGKGREKGRLRWPANYWKKRGAQILLLYKDFMIGRVTYPVEIYYIKILCYLSVLLAHSAAVKTTA